jgi:outer membrane lipoprotein SlyB
MNMSRKISLISLLSATLLIGACATTSGPNTFQGNQTGRAQSVQSGTIYAVRDVTIQNAPSRVGTATGAVLGGIAGSTLGGGSRAAAAGAVGGAVVGGAAAGTASEFRPGDAVRVTSDGQTTRVVRN